MSEFKRFYKDSVPQGVWWKIYGLLAESGRLRQSFPHLALCSREEFQEVVAGPGRHAWVILFREELAGVVYLSDKSGSSAYIHFAFVPTAEKRTKGRLPAPVAAGRFAVASLLRDKHEGEYILDTAIGLTPAANSVAVKMIMRCGAVKVGEIPGAIFDFGKDRNVTGIVTYYTRESTSDDWCWL